MVKNRLSTIFGFAGKIENSLTVLAVTLMALIPAAEVVARKFFKTGFPHSTEYTHHLVLILTFAAAMITSREGKHLCLSLALNIHEPLKSRIHAGNMMLSVTMVTAFAWSTLSFILSGFGPFQMVGIFP
ncbi:MAG: TRAP transporter small permease subunit, partial [bacterium]|nr:TRAP transporter small permease subunit [bacterium]